MAEEITIWDIIKNINEQSEPLDWNEIEKIYVPYITNKALSQYRDTVLFANEINAHFSIPAKWQYLFYFYALNKRKRFSKWEKSDTDLDQKIALLKEAYNYSTIKCREIIPIIDSMDAWEELEDSLDKGGAVVKKKRSKTQSL